MNDQSLETSEQLSLKKTGWEVSKKSAQEIPSTRTGEERNVNKGFKTRFTNIGD